MKTTKKQMKMKTFNITYVNKTIGSIENTYTVEEDLNKAIIKFNNTYGSNCELMSIREEFY